MPDPEVWVTHIEHGTLLMSLEDMNLPSYNYRWIKEKGPLLICLIFISFHPFPMSRKGILSRAERPVSVQIVTAASSGLKEIKWGRESRGGGWAVKCTGWAKQPREGRKGASGGQDHRMFCLFDDTHISTNRPKDGKSSDANHGNSVTITSLRVGSHRITVACTRGRGLKSGVMELGQKMGSIKGGQGLLLDQREGGSWRGMQFSVR